VTRPDGANHDKSPRRPGIWARRRQRISRLLRFGVGLKRWALIGAIGVAIWSIGFAWLIRQFSDLKFPNFLPWHLEGFLLLVLGSGSILAALYGFYRKLSPVLLGSQGIGEMADQVYTRWSRGRGPKIVAIGGGTGLSVLLRGLRDHTDNLTAIITVADDGGSSGRLRREMGVLPPGDFRNCLVAMSEDESLLGELFQYRFDEGNGLKGHSFGNLFIVAMTQVTHSFEQALVESSHVLAVRGQVIPSTLSNLSLKVKFADGTSVEGESNIGHHGGKISEISIDPIDAPGHPLAIKAIEEAELVVIGPGSLYTSILPNLLVPEISDAIKRTSAPIIYACNVATEVGETQGFAVAEHMETLRQFTFREVVDYVVANNAKSNLGLDYPGEQVVDDGRSVAPAKLELADLVDPERPIRHSSEKLAAAVMSVYRKSSVG